MPLCYTYKNIGGYHVGFFFYTDISGFNGSCITDILSLNCPDCIEGMAKWKVTLPAFPRYCLLSSRKS